MSQRDLAKAGPTAPTADERGGRCRVMGCTERPPVDEAAANGPPGRGMDAGDLQGFFRIEGRQDGGKAPRQQCLSGARAADHQEVMPSGGRHFERPPAAGQSPDHRQVRDGVILDSVVVRRVVRRCGRRRPVALTLEGRPSLGQGPGRQDPKIADEGRFGCIAGRDDHGGHSRAA
jgi:hypothetical protein